MRHLSHFKICSGAIHSLTRSHGAHETTHARTATRAAHWVLRAVDKGSGFLPGRGGLHARAGEALGIFDVARWSERTDEQELRMHHAWRRNGGRQSGQRGQMRAASSAFFLYADIPGGPTNRGGTRKPHVGVREPCSVYA